jgi:hypothetical protein
MSLSRVRGVVIGTVTKAPPRRKRREALRAVDYDSREGCTDWDDRAALRPQAELAV